MADDRRIINGVRVADRVITDVDELEKAASEKGSTIAGEKSSTIDMQRLHDSGAITGTWKGVKPAKAEKGGKEK